MSAVYSVSDFYSLTTSVAVAFLVMFFILTFFVMCKLLQRTPHRTKYLLLFFCYLSIVILVLSWSMPLIRYTNNCIPPNKPVFQQQAGQVQQVARFSKLPHHYVEGSFRHGMLVTIDDVEYYLLEDPRITPGEYLLFSAEVEDRLIICWETISKEQAEAFLPSPIPPQEEKPTAEPASPAAVLAGRILFFLGIAIIGVMIIGQDWIYTKKVFWLAQKDCQYRNGVVPNFTCFVEILLYFSGIALLVLGGSIQSNHYSALFLLAFGGCVMAFLCWLEMQVRVRFIGRHLVITNRGQEEYRSLDSIIRVYWDTRSFRNSARSLVITFSDRQELRLPQEHHWGLDDLYNRLRQDCPQLSE